MCEYQEIRYVHVMQHKDHPIPLRCGCECAGNMSGDYEGPKRRERLANNVDAWRLNWLDRTWQLSAKGNSYLKTDDFVITIYPDGTPLEGLRRRP
jgi:hypothetical protein